MAGDSQVLQLEIPKFSLAHYYVRKLSQDEGLRTPGFFLPSTFDLCDAIPDIYAKFFQSLNEKRGNMQYLLPPTAVSRVD